MQYVHVCIYAVTTAMKIFHTLKTISLLLCYFHEGNSDWRTGAVQGWEEADVQILHVCC